MADPLRIAVTGMGGFAACHHRALNLLEEQGLCRVVATCDPDPDAFAEAQREWRFIHRQVDVLRDYRKMLDRHAGNLDVLVIPAPVPLHAEMHARAVDHGLGVFLEKPPTLDPLELERMIEVDRDAPRPTCVGFNFIRQPERRALKTCILNGGFGKLEAVRVYGRWPRTHSYFQRNDWAAKLLTPDGRPMPDSCFGNAMSHYVHNALFWAGLDGEQHFARPAEVRAELYRGRDIEGTDTVFVEGTTTNGVSLRFALTHCCERPHEHGEQIVCEKAVLHWPAQSPARIEWRDGSGNVEELPWEDFNPVPHNLRAYFDFVRTGEGHPGTSLTESRPFVHLNALMYLSAGRIHTLGADRVTETGMEKDPLPVIGGIQDLQEAFLESGAWPGETVPDTATPENLPDFKDVLETIRNEKNE